MIFVSPATAMFFSILFEEVSIYSSSFPLSLQTCQKLANCMLNNQALASFSSSMFTSFPVRLIPSQRLHLASGKKAECPFFLVSGNKNLGYKGTGHLKEILQLTSEHSPPYFAGQTSASRRTITRWMVSCISQCC